jgi:hypothetical protein
LCLHVELPIICAHTLRTWAGLFYFCNASSPLKAPRIYLCDATYVNATANLHTIGNHEDLAQTCVPTSAEERAEAASVANFNASSSSLFECTTSSAPGGRYTETGFSCGYSQYSGFNCTGSCPCVSLPLSALSEGEACGSAPRPWCRGSYTLHPKPYTLHPCHHRHR